MVEFWNTPKGRLLTEVMDEFGKPGDTFFPVWESLTPEKQNELSNKHGIKVVLMAKGI
jgi:hypothetical protein